MQKPCNETLKKMPLDAPRQDLCRPLIRPQRVGTCKSANHFAYYLVGIVGVGLRQIVPAKAAASTRLRRPSFDNILLT